MNRYSFFDAQDIPSFFKVMQKEDLEEAYLRLLAKLEEKEATITSLHNINERYHEQVSFATDALEGIRKTFKYEESGIYIPFRYKETKDLVKNIEVAIENSNFEY